MESTHTSSSVSKNIPPAGTDTRDIVKRHLQDPNHTFSDEELRQVVISADRIDVADHPLIKALEKGRWP